MKIKINGSEIEVKEGDKIETPSAPVTPSEEDKEDAEEKDLLAQAKIIGKAIAKEAMVDLNLGDSTETSKKLDRIINDRFGKESKLKQILHGKDLYGSEELTKEEKIIGFFYGLVSNNEHILKALAEGTGADGGYLFPNEFLGEVLRDLPELNVMRQYVRVIPMKRDAMDITNLVSPLQVFWTAENAAKSTTTARFATQTLTAFKLAAILYSSDELIEDSTEVDVVSFIIGLFAEAVANEEERVIWNGNGTTQPQGINTATIASVGGTGNAYNDIVSVYYALPRKYRVNAAFFANDSVAKSLSLTKDTTGRPIFVQGTADAPTPTLLGKDLVISDWAPDRVLYFGDLKRGYFLGDRKRMTAKVSQDTETAFTHDQTAIRVVARIAGRVVLPAAIRKVTTF